MRTNQAESNQTILTKTPIPNTPKSHISTNVVIYNARAKQVAVKGFPHAGARQHPPAFAHSQAPPQPIRPDCPRAAPLINVHGPATTRQKKKGAGSESALKWGAPLQGEVG